MLSCRVAPRCRPREGGDPYVDGPSVARAFAGVRSDRLRLYVRPVFAVAEDRWPRWGPRREVQTYWRCRAPMGPTECLASWDRSITPSTAASFPAFAAGDAHAPLKLVKGFVRQAGLVMSMAFVSLFDHGPFLRPDRDRSGAPRTAAVKAGRRVPGAAGCGASRPRLDGGEHGARLAGLGRSALEANVAMRDVSGACAAIALAADHQLPGNARRLVGECHGRQLGRFALEERDPPERRVSAAAPHLLDDSRGAQHQHAPQRLVAGPRDHA